MPTTAQIKKRNVRHQHHEEEIVFAPVKVASLVAALLEWFGPKARDLPWRRTLDPYGIWISEIMLQQTQVRTVIPYWERWMRELPSVRALAGARADHVLKLWEGLGYYTRARNLQKAALRILDVHLGAFPTQYDEVLSLPGVGRYTAGAICSIAYNAPVPILDGNVIRVLTRFFGIDGDPRDKATNDQLWRLARQGVEAAARLETGALNVSQKQSRATPFALSGACSGFNQALMELGALICTPRSPHCEDCPLKAGCRAKMDRRIEQLPSLRPRIKTTQRTFVAFALQHRNRWLVRQRPAGVVNAHLWEFPSFEVVGKRIAPKSVYARQFRSGAVALTPLPVIRHSITRYRMILAPFTAVLADVLEPPGADYAWRGPKEVEGLALTSAHRKLWRRLRSP